MNRDCLEQELFTSIRDVTKCFYLEYLNNYLTISKMAEHYEISEDTARRLITLGRDFNNDWFIAQKDPGMVRNYLV